jgi:hypothetical protein
MPRGRPKGARNKRTIAHEALVKAGIEPIEVMLANMRHAYDQAVGAERALAALPTAKRPRGRQAATKKKIAELHKIAGYGRATAQACATDAAPYCHPRLAAITHGGDADNPMQHVVRVPPVARTAAEWAAGHAPAVSKK